MKTCILTFIVLGVVGLTGVDAYGQAEIVPEGDIEGAGDKDVEGWNPALGVSGTINLVNNTNVVGQVEGTSVLFGLGLAGGVDWIKGPQVWRTTLTLNEGVAKTPVVDAFIKTTDEISLTSSYNYFFAPKLGVFGQGKVTTALFNARAITADPETYAISPAEAGGMVETVTADDLKVSSAFKPLTIGYSGGGFAQPLKSKALTLRIRGGIGGRHTIASDVLVNNDNDTTPEIELQELANVHQFGFEVFAGLNGKLAKDDRLSYTAGASVLIPVINNDEFNRGAIDLTRIAIEGSVTVAVFDWMGLVYKGSLSFDPQLFPEGSELTQFQNSLLLTFQYTLIDRQKGLAELKKQAAIDQAKKEKAEAEKKQKEAEERAKQLEKELKEAKERLEQPPPAPTPAPTPSPTPASDPASGTP